MMRGMFRHPRGVHSTARGVFLTGVEYETLRAEITAIPKSERDFVGCIGSGIPLRVFKDSPPYPLTVSK